jgi:hypothetical protein
MGTGQNHLGRDDEDQEKQSAVPSQFVALDEINPEPSLAGHCSYFFAQTLASKLPFVAGYARQLVVDIARRASAFPCGGGKCLTGLRAFLRIVGAI